MTDLHGFTLLRDEQVEEINSRVRLYRHEFSGAQLLTMSNSEENKVFGVTFRTPPPDSTGVAHIMEHSVLCGSRKYPLREPFVELLKSSQATFLNAMTFPDKTCYPVASQILQDFYNLVDVYLDSVFYPTLAEHTLQQEGWHYDIDKADGEMEFKGVVYNEMKGAYSSPGDVLERSLQRALFPDNNYGLDSGGDPAVIPSLTYQAFRDFHARYYHPANALLFFYGDDPEDKRLEILNDYLKDFPAIQVDSSVDFQPLFSEPRRTRQVYAVSEGEEGKAQLCLGWVLGEGWKDPQTALGLAILAHILTGTPASPLRKALIDSGLGEDLTGPGLDGNYRQMLYAAGMKGVDPSNTGKVEELLLGTLRRLVREGIDPETVAASLNTVEFRLRERNTGGWPRGLIVLFNTLETWVYGGDLFEAQRINAPLRAIRELSGRRYFEDLIQRWLLDNPHRVTVELLPDAGLASRLREEEAARLRLAREAMSPEDIDKAVRVTLDLRRRQETADSPEALATIPVLRLVDLDRKARTIPSQAGGRAQTRLHGLDTGGIVYLDLAFNLHGIEQRLLPLLPLFSRMLTETGTKELDFVRLLQRIGQKTGGISRQLLFSARRGQPQAAAWLVLRGKAMNAQLGDLLELINAMLTEARLDDKARFSQMLLESRAMLETSLSDRGHGFVNNRLRAAFSEAGWLGEITSGLDQLFYLRELASRMESDWPAIQADLESLRDSLFSQSGLIANLTADESALTGLDARLGKFIDGLRAGSFRMMEWERSGYEPVEGFSIPVQVNYVGKAFKLTENASEAHGSVMAVMQNLQTTWLWERVRVRGGAYGGLAAWDPYAQVLSFFSYRDPNLLDTLDIYDQTADYLSRLDLPAEELEKAVIGAVGDLDAYQLPDAKGYTSLVRELAGIDDAWRQAYRDQLMGASLKDFRRFGEQLKDAAGAAKVAVLASSAAFDRMEQIKPGWMTVRKAL